MSHELFGRDDAGAWRWNHPAIDLDEGFDTPEAAVQAGVEAIRGAVDDGRLGADQASELAADARFALGAQEHHLGGTDADAFDELSTFEAEMDERA